MTTFSNLPSQNQPSKNSVDSVVQTFNNFYSVPIQLDAGVLNAMIGFFENKGFDPSTAQSISVIIMTQAQQDRFDPMTVLDSLKGFDTLQLSSLAAQILNYNRSKTSYLGLANKVAPFPAIQRNVIA